MTGGAATARAETGLAVRARSRRMPGPFAVYEVALPGRRLAPPFERVVDLEKGK